MNFRSRRLQQMLIVATYAILLYLVLSHLDRVSAALGYLSGVMTPIVLGICIAYVVNLLLKLVENRLLAPLWEKVPRLARAKRGICLLITFLLVALILTALVMFIVPQIGQSAASLAAQVPSFVNQAGAWLSRLAQNYQVTSTIWQELSLNWKEIASTLSGFVTTTVPQLLNFTIGFTSGVMNLVLGVTLAVYMLLDKERLISMLRKLSYAFLPKAAADHLCAVCREANRIFSSFIAGQIAEACILGTLCALSMTLLRFPYPLLIGVVVGVTALIPILGAYIGTIPSAFIILMESGPLRAVGFVVFIVCLQQFEGNVIYPKVVGGSIGLRGIWVLVAITVGGSLFGLPGMVVGVPVFAVLYTLVRQLTYKRLREKEVPGEEDFPED